MLSPFALELPAILLGLLLGSFLNVIISRLPRKESIVTPGSRCPACATPIRPYDNIPVLSWLLLRARCRACKQPIPWRYPLVELAAALWLALVAARLHLALTSHPTTSPPPFTPEVVIQTIALAILGLLLIALIVIDWQHQILPDALTLPGILAGILLVCAEAVFLPTGIDDLHFNPRNNLRLRSPGSFIARGDVFLTGTERLVFGRIAAVLSVVLLLLLVRWIYQAVRHHEGMGIGDAKLLGLIAAFLGLSPAILALFLGVLLATGYAVLLLARRRAGALTRLPFGSFLGVGGLLSALFGPGIIAWYRTLL